MTPLPVWTMIAPPVVPVLPTKVLFSISTAAPFLMSIAPAESLCCLTAPLHTSDCVCYRRPSTQTRTNTQNRKLHFSAVNGNSQSAMSEESTNKWQACRHCRECPDMLTGNAYAEPCTTGQKGMLIATGDQAAKKDVLCPDCPECTRPCTVL